MSEFPCARDELIQTGRLGTLGVALLYKTVRQVVRMRNMPPPTPAGWTEDAIAEAAHDVFTARNGPARLLELAIGSTDEKNFRALLWKLVLNDLISAGRRTERGKLSERLKRVLAEMPDVRVDGNGLLWLINHDTAVRDVRPEQVDSALAAVPVSVPTWRADAAHSAPVADRASLEALVLAALGAGNGALTYSALVSAVAGRLGVHDSPDLMDHEQLDFLLTPAPDQTEDRAVSTLSGHQLLEKLTVEQQLVLPYLEDSVTVLTDRTGLRRTRAWTVSRELKVRLLDLLATDPDRGSTLRAAREEALRRWGGR